MLPRTLRVTPIAPLTLALVFACAFTGCDEPGPAEQTGQSIDQAIDDTANALDPSGPAESIGESIDDTLNLEN